MDLKSYVAEYKHNKGVPMMQAIREVCADAGISQSCYYSIISAAHMPTHTITDKLMAASGGKIKRWDMIKFYEENHER